MRETAANKTRTQRRMEKKQAVILLVLVLVVSLASFTLGVFVGRRGAERDIAQKQLEAEKILVAKTSPVVLSPPVEPAVPAPVEPAPQDQAQNQPPTKLTFYDNLAKQEPPPLGSGINLPPQPATPAPPIPLPAEPIVRKTAPEAVATPPVAVAEAAPQLASAPLKVEPKGGYAVQVGSFAAADDAERLKKRLIDKGYPAFVAAADLGAKGVWHRVKVGPYGSEAAKGMQQLLEKQEQIKGFVARQ